MRIGVFICLLLCAFLVSQSINQEKKINKMAHVLERLETEASSGSSLAKADRFVAEAEKAIREENADKAAELLAEARVELNRQMPEKTALPEESSSSGEQTDLKKDYVDEETSAALSRLKEDALNCAADALALLEK